MKCNNSCIYYAIISGINPIKDATVIKIMCDYHGEFIKNLPDEKRCNCCYYKTKEDVKYQYKK
jgi:hypothetical protein